jgi:hypothetical protein
VCFPYFNERFNERFVVAYTRYALFICLHLQNNWVPRRAENVAKSAKQGQGLGRVEVKGNHALVQGQGYQQNAADMSSGRHSGVRSNCDAGQAMLEQEVRSRIKYIYSTVCCIA